MCTNLCNLEHPFRFCSSCRLTVHPSGSPSGTSIETFRRRIDMLSDPYNNNGFQLLVLSVTLNHSLLRLFCKIDKKCKIDSGSLTFTNEIIIESQYVLFWKSFTFRIYLGQLSCFTFVSRDNVSMCETRPHPDIWTLLGMDQRPNFKQKRYRSHL